MGDQSPQLSLPHLHPHHSDKNRFTPTPDHFPSFNISISDSSEEVEEEEEEEAKNIQCDKTNESKIEMEIEEVSKTRSGKRYK